jgi:hypothetical protein
MLEPTRVNVDLFIHSFKDLFPAFSPLEKVLAMKRIKCVAVGGEDKDRVELLFAYIRGESPTTARFIPSIFENHNKIIEDHHILVQLWDGPENDPLDALSLSNVDVFVICFSLVLPSSLKEIQNGLVSRIKKYSPAAPYVLVGLNSDLRDSFERCAEEYRSKGWEPVSTASGEDLKTAIGARAYIECSATLYSNVNQVFETAVKVAQAKSEKKKDCQIA